MLVESFVSWIPGIGRGIGPSPPLEEMEEVTEVVVKNSWSDFVAFLLGSEELGSGEVEVSSIDLQGHIPETPKQEAIPGAPLLISEPSFSKVMASIISTDVGAESSENDEATPERSRSLENRPPIVGDFSNYVAYTEIPPAPSL